MSTNTIKIGDQIRFRRTDRKHRVLTGRVEYFGAYDPFTNEDPAELTQEQYESGHYFITLRQDSERVTISSHFGFTLLGRVPKSERTKPLYEGNGAKDRRRASLQACRRRIRGFVLACKGAR